MVRKQAMFSFLLSIKLETAFVSGSDTGPVPQNVKLSQSVVAPIPEINRKPQGRHHGLCLALTWVGVEMEGGWVGRNHSYSGHLWVESRLAFACLSLSWLNKSFKEEYRKAGGLMFRFRNKLPAYVAGEGRCKKEEHFQPSFT